MSEVPTAVTLRNTADWNVRLCCLIRSYILEKPAAAIKMAAAGLSEMQINFYQITWCRNLKEILQ
jgi:hypothetical protein